MKPKEVLIDLINETITKQEYCWNTLIHKPDACIFEIYKYITEELNRLRKEYEDKYEKKEKIGTITLSKGYGIGEVIGS